MDLNDHPGYLGWTSRGVVLIHANWPAYAIEHGAAYSLGRLGQFPLGMPFVAIDDIDQCVLFRVGLPHPKKDDFDETHFHVALWHDDLLDLFSHGWVEGVAGNTPRQWAERQCEELARVVLRLADGRPVPLPKPGDFDDTQATVAVVSRDGMRLTEAGLAELQRVIVARRTAIPASLANRIEPLIQVRAYDAAVREACVLLETVLRATTGRALSGQALVEAYCAQRRQRSRIIDAHLKWLRSELRTCFRFVRNDFMHNLRDLTEEQCLALVCRIADVYSHVVEAA